MQNYITIHIDTNTQNENTKQPITWSCRSIQDWVHVTKNMIRWYQNDRILFKIQKVAGVHDRECTFQSGLDVVWICFYYHHFFEASTDIPISFARLCRKREMHGNTIPVVRIGLGSLRIISHNSPLMVGGSLTLFSDPPIIRRETDL